MAKFKEMQPQASAGPHSDSYKNIRFFEAFFRNCDGKLPEGMKIKLVDSEGMRHSVVMISWQAGFRDKVGPAGSPVSVHQKHEDFVRAFKEGFVAIHSKANMFWSQNPIALSTFRKQKEEETAKAESMGLESPRIACPDFPAMTTKGGIVKLNRDKVNDPWEDFS